MFSEIISADGLEHVIASEAAVLVYFSTDSCSVCKSLKPKVELALNREFPKLKTVYVKTDELPEAAGQHRVFAIPTVLVYFYGKETIRKARMISVDVLISEISRPYSMIFQE